MGLFTLLHLAWLSIDGLGLAGLAVAGALAAALLLLPLWVPRIVRHALLAVAVAVALLSLGLQLGHQRGAHEALEQASNEALKAETTRADLAEKTRDAIAAQAAADNADLQARNRTLQEINDDLAQDRDADRECVDRDTARRLRDDL